MSWDSFLFRPVVIQSLAAKIPRLSNRGTPLGVGKPQTSWFQPNAVTAIFQEALSNDWLEGTSRWSGSGFSAASQYHYTRRRLSSVVSTSPVVLPRCLPARNMSTGAGQVSFPVKTWAPRKINDPITESREWEDRSEHYNVIIPEMRTTHSLQHQWIDLPTDQFGPVSGGLLLQLPRTVPDNSQAVVACSISASWLSGPVTSDSTVDQGAYAFAEWDFQKRLSLSLVTIRSDLNASSAEASKFRRLISIHDEWSDL